MERSSALGVFVLAVVMVGCGLLKKKAGNEDADAAATGANAVAEGDAASAPPPAAGAPIAANVGDISRLPDETPIDKVPATLQRATNLRELPGVGKVVSTLPKGAVVFQLARVPMAFLVLFEDDSKSQRKVMGWVSPESFSPLTAAASSKPIKPPGCKAPEVALMGDAPFCGRVCTGDGACPSGQRCNGSASTFANGKVNAAVTVCTVFARPVVVPVVPVVAGGPTVADTGRAASSTTAPAPPSPPSAPAAATPSTGLPPCAENRDPKSLRTGPPCLELPHTGRPNGMQCHNGSIQCSSQLCVGGVCTACRSDGECGAPNFCRGGKCFAPCTPNGQHCQMGTECCSKNCVAKDEARMSGECKP